MYTPPAALPGFQATRALNPLFNLIGNQYEKIDVERIDLEVKMEDKRKTAVIEAIRIDKNRYRPGEKIEVTCVSVHTSKHR